MTTPDLLDIIFAMIAGALTGEAMFMVWAMRKGVKP